MMLGLILQAYRKQYNISVRQMAKRIGITHTSLWRFEQNREVSGKHWIAIINWILTEKRPKLKSL